ncbi:MULTISPECIES: GNAT family N-acetyltransferase [Solibacillus]|uniref:GNAT family N-acetyltransferase n=1 Tax=Solibacillus merdavium TaxID=2762218 RepID=A0ABR8XN18_9BACL|nr:GNAT family N-acetyltransferase [Solibacillus merdavium]MBD8033334.1 GNAT family N-acetyltransferase [Solibacillus merdavium]
MVYESAFVPEGQKPFPRTILNEPSVSKYVEGWGKQSGDIGLIAENEQQAIGAIWLRLFDEAQKGFGNAETPEIGIAILKEFRGKGIEHALMRALEAEAIKFEYQKLCLNVDPRNSACRLYKQLDYVHVGWHDTYWIMEKKLV